MALARNLIAWLVLSAIALFIAAIFLAMYLRKRYRKRKDRERAEALRQELALDFDTRDLETSYAKFGHMRSTSESSLIPLVKGDALMQQWDNTQGRRNFRDSVASFESYSSDAPLLRPSSSSSIQASHSRPGSSSLTTAELQRDLVSKPSIPPKPRMVPQPPPRHTRRRSEFQPRPSPLSLPPSRRRSLESMDRPLSPASVYSQASARTAELHAANSPSVFVAAQDAPPVPSFPPYLHATSANAHTFYPSPRQLPSPPRSPDLQDSLAYPLPSPGDDHSRIPTRSLSQFYRGLWAEPDSPPRQSQPRKSSESSTFQESLSDIISVHSSEVSHGTPHYTVPSYSEKPESATIGYQLPPGWRAD